MWWRTVQDAVQETSKDDEDSRKASQVLAFGEGLTTGSVGKIRLIAVYFFAVAVWLLHELSVSVFDWALFCVASFSIKSSLSCIYIAYVLFMRYRPTFWTVLGIVKVKVNVDLYSPQKPIGKTAQISEQSQLYNPKYYK